MDAGRGALRKEKADERDMRQMFRKQAAKMGTAVAKEMSLKRCGTIRVAAYEKQLGQLSDVYVHQGTVHLSGGDPASTGVGQQASFSGGVKSPLRFGRR